MSDITIKVDSAAVEARLTRMGPAIRAALAKAVEREAIALQRLVKEKLSGPVLKNKTGRLRRSINYRVSESETAVSGSVGTNVRYARAHELGFDGVVSVREHLRHITQAFGRPITPVDAVVPTHSRHMHLPQRSFLRSSLEERAPQIRESLIAAVRGAVQ
jgi:phage gpG-like protein